MDIGAESQPCSMGARCLGHRAFKCFWITGEIGTIICDNTGVDGLEIKHWQLGEVEARVTGSIDHQIRILNDSQQLWRRQHRPAVPLHGMVIVLIDDPFSKESKARDTTSTAWSESASWPIRRRITGGLRANITPNKAAWYPTSF